MAFTAFILIATSLSVPLDAITVYDAYICT